MATATDIAKWTMVAGIAGYVLYKLLDREKPRGTMLSPVSQSKVSWSHRGRQEPYTD